MFVPMFSTPEQRRLKLPLEQATIMPMIALAAMLLQAGAYQLPDDVSAAQKAWVGCVREATTRYAHSAEPAETVVTGAFGACSAEERVVRDLYERELNQGMAEARMKHFRGLLREASTRLILEVRMAKPAH